MNIKNLVLGISLSLILNSCGVKKEYSSCQDVIDNVKGDEYDNLVKVWGEPDYVSDIYNTDPTNSELNLRITARWGSNKVKVKGQDHIELNFSATVTLSANYPHRVESIHCD